MKGSRATDIWLIVLLNLLALVVVLIADEMFLDAIPNKGTGYWWRLGISVLIFSIPNWFLIWFRFAGKRTTSN